MSSKSKKIVFIALGVIIIVAGIFFGYNFFKQDFKIKEFDDEIELAYGGEYTENTGNICYGNGYSCNKVEVTSEGSVDTNKIDKYEVIYTYTYKGKKITKKQIVSVVDKTEPEITINDTNIKVCPNGKYGKINYSATDNVDGDLTDKVTAKYENNKLIFRVSDNSGNTTTKEVEAEAKDSNSPVMKLKGSTIVYLTIGEKYTDAGAIANDNCDENIEIKVENNVDTSKKGTYKVNYSATDSSGNKSTISRTVIVDTKAQRKPEEQIKKGARIIYLTFDDGPGQYTDKLLDVLKKYDVKVTFFVTGKGSDSIIKREFDEGHTVALHSYSHDYSKIYKNVDAYFNDLYQIQNRVKKITGEESKIIRFPGGGSNTVSRKYDGGTHIMSKLAKEVQNRGFYYFDWNVSSGDAAAKAISSDQVYKNVIKSLKEDYSVVLQHDIKGFSVDAVERIIQYGLANGYTFERLTETSPGAHHGINN